MKPKTIRVLYWTLLIIFALFMLMDGAAGVAQEETGREVMQKLGYPFMLMTICGVAKILGAIALLQQKFKTLTEWAFAGFTINFIGGGASWILAGYGVGMAVPALVILVVMFLLYYLWKRYEKIKTV